MPSLASAFYLVEMLLASMAVRSDAAAERISELETRIARFGGYL
jgi:hypothetical protein